MKRGLFLASITVISVFTAFMVQFFLFNDGKLHIVICDVGQGDAIFIRTPQGSDILIDGGPSQKVLECLSSNMPFWDRKLENVFLTHPDADHLRGIIGVLKRYEVIAFYTQPVPGQTELYLELKAVLAEKSMSARYLEAGEVLRDESGMRLSTLWPTTSAVQEMSQKTSNTKLPLNEVSLIQVLEYGEFRALFTGDASIEVGEKVASEAGDIDFLKIPHHGSKNGMSENYLDILLPELAVASAGYKNRYGHPAPSSLKLLKEAGIETLRTDLDGSIEIVSDGNSWSYRTSR